MIERDSDELLLRGARRDPEAFGVFYRRYEDAVLAFFMRRVRDPELAADLSAEVFAGALAGARKFRGSASGSAVAWLFGIARNVLARSHQRGQVDDRFRRKLQMEALVLADTTVDAIARLDGDAAVQSLLAALPAAEAQAVRARVLDAHEYADIAVALKCSEQLVRKRVSRGLARLRNREVQP